MEGISLDLRDNVCPSNKPPMLLDTTRQSNLLTDLGTRGGGERKTGGVSLDGNDLGTGGGGTNVDHEHFVLAELRDLGLLAVGGLDTEQPSEKKVVDCHR